MRESNFLKKIKNNEVLFLNYFKYDKNMIGEKLV